MIPPIRVYVFCDKKTEHHSDENIYRCVMAFFRWEKENDNRYTGDEALFLGKGMVDADKELVSDGFPKIIREEGKKPYFAIDIGLYFSISHSNGFWVCAVSRQEVGIDIEKKRKDYNPGIAKRFFHADEHQYLENNGFDDFFMIWTAKESYVKYTGQGISDSFSTFTVVKDGQINQGILEAEIRFLPVNLEYCLCLCAKKIDKIWIERL